MTTKRLRPIVGGLGIATAISMPARLTVTTSSIRVNPEFLADCFCM